MKKTNPYHVKMRIELTDDSTGEVTVKELEGTHLLFALNQEETITAQIMGGCTIREFIQQVASIDKAIDECVKDSPNLRSAIELKTMQSYIIEQTLKDTIDTFGGTDEARALFERAVAKFLESVEADDRDILNQMRYRPSTTMS